MLRALLVVILVSAGLFVGLTAWTSHATSATAAASRAFAQHAKSVCSEAPHSASGLAAASRQLGGLAEPPNVHRAVARLQFHWGRLTRMLRAGIARSSKEYRAELHQAFLSAHLLNISACQSVAPK
jgi:hypothetical protein